MSVVAIIPARGGSTRLPRKNIHPVLGRPMIAWVIDACRESRRIDRVYVTTEDDEIASTARACGAQVVRRPPELARDDVFKMEAVAHAVGAIEEEGIVPEIVLSVQPNSPELTAIVIDAAIDRLRERDLWEVFSVGPDLVQNGAFRVMRRPVVSQRTLSVHCGVVVADLVDIHTLKDVAAVEQRLRERHHAARTGQ